MAILIPEEPREFKPNSLEDIMFHALETGLTNDYYVVHSLQWTKTENDVFREFEADFVVFNPSKGMLVLEAKAGHVRCEQGVWKYGSGKRMNGDGPYQQARKNMHGISDRLAEAGLGTIKDNLKIVYGVWFPSLTKEELLSLALPPEAEPDITLTKESLLDPTPDIERIFSFGRIENNISRTMGEKLVKDFFCPYFDVVPSVSFTNDLSNYVFHRLLKEQSNVLNFLVDQKTAVINGAAGTGKTLIAVEKANRDARSGEKTLFLCYNSALKEKLSAGNENSNIDFYTIDGLACRLCNTPKADYARLKDKLGDYYCFTNFPYTHVIVDEGQDFGQEEIEESSILDSIKSIIEDTKENGSFFVFYDKLQLVQGEEVPEYIREADCKVTLYKNCRNTENIAKTALRPITERKPVLMDNYIPGTPTKLHFCEDADQAATRIDSIIDSLLARGLKDFIILTCKTEETSILSPYITKGKYIGRFRFSTCRKFKGLEADAVILIDVDETTFMPENVMRYYVGTSRARLNLDIVTAVTNEACINILTDSLNKTGKIKDPKRDLAKALNAIPVLKDPD